MIDLVVNDIYLFINKYCHLLGNWQKILGKKIIFNGKFSMSMKFPKLILASDKSRKVKDWVSSL